MLRLLLAAPAAATASGLAPQQAALTGGARDGNGKLLQLSLAAPWRQEHLRRLGLGGGAKANLQVWWLGRLLLSLQRRHAARLAH